MPIQHKQENKLLNL